MSEQENE